MAIEFALKYRATPALLQQVCGALPGQEQSLQMRTQYYDTPSGSLSARHYTLRQRMENDKSVCTLKYPVSGVGRGELELECDTLEEALPHLCRESGLGDLPGLLEEGLVPVCGARFTRLAKTVRYAGAVLELALDEGVLTAGDREEPLCEIEVELKEGAPEAAVACGSWLQKTFSLEPEPKSKFRRARELAQKGEE